MWNYDYKVPEGKKFVILFIQTVKMRPMISSQCFMRL